MKGVRTWLQEIGKIFKVMACTDAQQVLYGTHMLTEEVEYWWNNAQQRFQAAGIYVTQVVFRVAFLEKYIPVDV